MKIGTSEVPSARCEPVLGYAMVSGGKKPRPLSSALAANTFPPASETMGRKRLDDGSDPQVRSDDEMAPVNQQMPLPVSPPLDVANPELGPLRSDSRDGYMTHVHTPKRPGVD